MTHIQKPRYKHLLQKKSFCSAACIQMILFRRNFWIDQELLAKELDIKVCEDDLSLYVKKFMALPKGHPQIGFPLENFENDYVKDVLKTLHLKAKVHKLSEIENLEEFIASNIDCGRDVMLNIWWEPLTKRKHGHYVLVSEFDSEKGEATVFDPHYASKNEWTITTDQIKESMLDKWDGQERGLVIFSYTKK